MLICFHTSGNLQDRKIVVLKEDFLHSRPSQPEHNKELFPAFSAKQVLSKRATSFVVSGLKNGLMTVYEYIHMINNVLDQVVKKKWKIYRKCILPKINFYLKLSATELNNLEENNQLKTKDRVEQSVATKLFKYQKGTSPFYLSA